MKKFSHLDEAGAAKMVDVSAKPDKGRRAVAQGEIRLQPATLAALEENRLAKGNVFGIARVAGIMAAKKTGETYPALPSAFTDPLRGGFFHTCQP